MNAEYMRAAGKAARAVLAALDGKPIEAVRYAVDAALDLVPVDDLRQMLTDEAVRRQNAIADIAEEAKFGTLPQLFDLDDPEEP